MGDRVQKIQSLINYSHYEQKGILDYQKNCHFELKHASSKAEKKRVGKSALERLIYLSAAT